MALEWRIIICCCCCFCWWWWWWCRDTIVSRVSVLCNNRARHLHPHHHRNHHNRARQHTIARWHTTQIVDREQQTGSGNGFMEMEIAIIVAIGIASMPITSNHHYMQQVLAMSPAPFQVPFTNTHTLLTYMHVCIII